jgi:L-ascorbate metabolism protein UlaG (beta-lactamase superfamily)
MQVSYLGGTGVKLVFKVGDKDISALIDPNEKDSSDILILSQNNPIEEEIKTNFTVKTPGEIETKNVLLSAIYGDHDGHLITRLDAENLSIAHLGKIQKPLKDEHLELIGGVDILIIPIGEKDTMPINEIIKLIHQVEPKIVIPCDFENAEQFLKVSGLKNQVFEKKATIKEKDVEGEDINIYVVTK